MKILMTTDCVGGVWSYTTTLCAALAPLEVRVVLVATGGELTPDQRREVAALPNVELHHRPLRCEWMDEPWEDVAEAGRWLDALVVSHAPDLVHVNDFAHGRRKFGVPKVVVGHSCVLSWFSAVHGHLPGTHWDRYRHVVSAGLAGADVVIAPTGAMLDQLQRHYDWAGPGEVVANAVEPPAEPVGLEREPLILAAGRVWDEAKNIRRLAEAAEGLAWPAVVAGDGRHPDGGTVTFENLELTGPLPRQELFTLMSKSAVYALPARYEPFGLSIAEAAIRGCALVLGDIPSLREVWGDSARFIPPDDPAALRQALQELIAHPAERRRLAKAARRRADRYAPARQAQAYLDLYRRHAVPQLAGT